MSATPAVADHTPRPARQRLAGVTIGLLEADAVGFAVIAALFAWVSVLLVGHASSASIGNWADVLDVANTLTALGLFLTAIVFLVWLFRTVTHVRRLGWAITSPWLAVLWWFVPLAWFVMPYRVVRDLHARLAPDDTSLGGHLVGVWWATWLGSWLLYAVDWALTGRTVTRADAQAVAGLTLVYSLSLVAIALLTARIVRALSRGLEVLVASNETDTKG